MDVAGGELLFVAGADVDGVVFGSAVFLSLLSPPPDSRANATIAPISRSPTTRAGTSSPLRRRPSSSYVVVPGGGGVGAAGRGAADPTPAAGNASVRPARSSATVATTGAAASAVLSAAASCSCARTVAMPARSCGSLRSRPPSDRRERAGRPASADRVGDDGRQRAERVVGLERRPALDGGVEGRAERPQVDRRAGRLAAGALGGHVGGGAEEHAGGR